MSLRTVPSQPHVPVQGWQVPIFTVNQCLAAYERGAQSGNLMDRRPSQVWQQSQQQPVSSPSIRSTGGLWDVQAHSSSLHVELVANSQTGRQLMLDSSYIDLQECSDCWTPVKGQHAIMVQCFAHPVVSGALLLNCIGDLYMPASVGAHQ